MFPYAAGRGSDWIKLGVPIAELAPNSGAEGLLLVREESVSSPEVRVLASIMPATPLGLLSPAMWDLFLCLR